MIEAKIDFFDKCEEKQRKAGDKWSADAEREEMLVSKNYASFCAKPVKGVEKD